VMRRIVRATYLGDKLGLAGRNQARGRTVERVKVGRSLR